MVAFQTSKVRNGTDGTQLWSRDLSNGDKAVVLFNNGKGAPAVVAVGWGEVGWVDSDQVSVRDLWAKTYNGTVARGFTCSLMPHDVCFLRLKKVSKLTKV